MATNLEIAGLLEESGWLRALAASLIGDGTQADDLVQDTWLAALRRPPRSASEPRPWLARVARNLARNTRRERTRRQAREEFVAEERAHPGSDVLAQQAEAQRLLADAVTRLPEPLRAVIVLRYFQGLDSSAAAARLGLPASTVRTRLQRALEELRTDLDRHFEGGRAGWGLVLAPLVRGGQGASGSAPASATSGAAALSSWSPAVVASAGAVCVLVTAGALYLGLRNESSESENALAALPQAVVKVQAQGLQESSGGRESIPPVPARTPVTSSSTTTTTAAALPGVEPDGTVLAGKVLVDGRVPEWPIGIRLEPTVPPVTPGDKTPRMRTPSLSTRIPPEQQGKFFFYGLSPSWSGKLTVSDFPFASGEDSLAIDAPRADLVVALASGPAIFGRILDPEGHPVPDLEGAYEFRLGNEGKAAHEINTSWRFDCIADGRFRIPSKSRGDWCSLTLLVEAEGHGYLHLETPTFVPADGYDLGELVLEPVRTLAFTVRDPRGAPIEGAFARVDGIPWSQRSASTGVDGSGNLPFAPSRAVDVRVSAPGFADRVEHAPDAGGLEVVLEPLSILDLQLVGALAVQADRVRLSAERAAFVWDETDWDERAKLQAELGSIQWNVRRIPVLPGELCEYEFQRQYDGHYRLVGLVPDVELTVEVLDDAERVLAVETVSVASQACATLELGDPNSHASEPVREGMQKRRSAAAPR